ncbi:unnamed protein product, partial [Staurois parvus]
VLPISAAYQCPSVLPSVPSVPPNSASQCHLTAPYIIAAFQCPSVMPVNATYQCLLISFHQCHLSVSISSAYQCPSLQPH